MEHLAETYAAEIGTLCVHRLGGRQSILQGAGNPFAIVSKLATVLVGAVLSVPAAETSLSERFASVGGSARDRGVSEAVLLADVGEMLQIADLYLSHAAPVLLQTPTWIDLWLAVNETAVRAAMYGYTQRALSFRVQEIEESLPSIKRFRRGMFPVFPGDPNEAVRSASERLDLTDDVVIGSDTSGTILYWSDQAENRYGRGRASALGLNVLDLTPASRSRAAAEIILRGAAEGEPWSGPFLVRDVKGLPQRVQRTDMPVQHAGRVFGVVGLRHFEGVGEMVGM
jgi:PAS domain-containing protein